MEEESLSSLFGGLGVALLAIFVLLTIEFKSYVQPLLILLIIPFGMIGAVAGHWVVGRPLELFSVLGIVGLSGIVINDSIILIDFINRMVRSGVPVREALLEAGSRRVRPVLLTSTTTIGGLLPILLETSFQAQMLIPMATSIAFGLMFTTMLVLYLVPVFYSIYVGICGPSALSGEPEATETEANAVLAPELAGDAPRPVADTVRS